MKKKIIALLLISIFCAPSVLAASKKSSGSKTKTSSVKSYTKKNGTHVKSHRRKKK